MAAGHAQAACAQRPSVEKLLGPPNTAQACCGSALGVRACDERAVMLSCVAVGEARLREEEPHARENRVTKTGRHQDMRTLCVINTRRDGCVDCGWALAETGQLAPPPGRERCVSIGHSLHRPQIGCLAMHVEWTSLEVDSCVGVGGCACVCTVYGAASVC